MKTITAGSLVWADLIPLADGLIERLRQWHRIASSKASPDDSAVYLSTKLGDRETAAPGDHEPGEQEDTERYTDGALSWVICPRRSTASTFQFRSQNVQADRGWAVREGFEDADRPFGAAEEIDQRTLDSILLVEQATARNAGAEPSAPGEFTGGIDPADDAGHGDPMIEKV